MMHLLIGAKPGLLSTFFSLVKKRLCSPELKRLFSGSVHAGSIQDLGKYHIPKCMKLQNTLAKRHKLFFFFICMFNQVLGVPRSSSSTS